MTERADTERRSGVILVAIEPRTYAHAIGVAIAELRPRFEVRIVDPEDIDFQARSLGARVVLCSRPKPFSVNGEVSWVEYRPYAEAPEAEIRVDRVATGRRNISLDDMLEIVDRAVSLSHV